MSLRITSSVPEFLAHRQSLWGTVWEHYKDLLSRASEDREKVVVKGVCRGPDSYMQAPFLEALKVYGGRQVYKPLSRASQGTDTLGNPVPGLSCPYLGMWTKGSSVPSYYIALE